MTGLRISVVIPIPNEAEELPTFLSSLRVLDEDTEVLFVARAQDRAVKCLPPWYDIDVGADLERLKDSLERGQGSEARYTRRFFGLAGA